MKKRKDRKRSTWTENKAIREKESASMVKEHALYEYNSDFEDFDDNSSNDEGFASGQAAVMSDAISPVDTARSQFTPRLTTMHAEYEEIVDPDNVHDTIESYANVLNEGDLEGYDKSEALNDENYLLQKEPSLEIILQPYVSQRFCCFPETWLLNQRFSSFIDETHLSSIKFFMQEPSLLPFYNKKTFILYRLKVWSCRLFLSHCWKLWKKNQNLVDKTKYQI